MQTRPTISTKAGSLSYSLSSSEEAGAHIKPVSAPADSREGLCNVSHRSEEGDELEGEKVLAASASEIFEALPVTASRLPEVTGDAPKETSEDREIACRVSAVPAPAAASAPASASSEIAKAAEPAPLSSSFAIYNLHNLRIDTAPGSEGIALNRRRVSVPNLGGKY